MKAVDNPYAPGAGTPPPELAGRDELLETVAIAIERIRRGNPAKSLMLVGLRGVGKTVLLERMRQNAEAEGRRTIHIEAREGASLPALLAPPLRTALLQLSKVEQAKALTHRALRALAGFTKAFKFKVGALEMSVEPELGLADSGNLEIDLGALFEEIGRAAREADNALVLFIDELQYVRKDEFAALISALHLASQRKLPVCMVAAGLPQLLALAGNAKSYAERLFDYPRVDKLPESAACQAIVTPALDRGVEFEPAAVDDILERTGGYPYFLQEWGRHAWEVADRSPITVDDVNEASAIAVSALDENFFRVRFDRLTPFQKRYVRAMAELGPGPHRSGDVATELNRPVTQLGPVRKDLISKGMIWSPSYGDTAFTVPLFDEFMKRIMPGDAWRAE